MILPNLLDPGHPGNLLLHILIYLVCFFFFFFHLRLPLLRVPILIYYVYVFYFRLAVVGPRLRPGEEPRVDVGGRHVPVPRRAEVGRGLEAPAAVLEGLEERGEHGATVQVGQGVAGPGLPAQVQRVALGEFAAGKLLKKEKL